MLKVSAAARLSTLPLLSLAVPASAQVPLDSPAAVVWHEPSRSWFVSNSGPPPTGSTSGGWIARLDANDKRPEPYWLTGLNAPRGMAIAGGRLYVADQGEIVVIDMEKRSVQARHAIPKARLLHGVAADAEGNIYVSDTLANAIYRLPAGGTPERFLASDVLEGPTGLAVQGSDLVVASWGVITDPATLATRIAGRLLRVDLRTKAVRPILAAPLGHLDGLAPRDDGYFVTDRPDGKLLWVSAAGATRVVRGGLKSPGGIGVASRQRVVAVPERDADNVVFVPLP
jgi:DNA-binding beta-propeller fold protein YncE